MAVEIEMQTKSKVEQIRQREANVKGIEDREDLREYANELHKRVLELEKALKNREE
jgi:hypothetical protein